MMTKLIFLLSIYLVVNGAVANEPEVNIACKIPSGVYQVVFDNNNKLSLGIENGYISSFSGLYQEQRILGLFGEDQEHVIEFNLLASSCVNNKLIIVWDTSEDSPSYLSKNSGILYGRYSQNIIIFDDIAEYPSNLSTFSGMTSGTKEPIKMLLMEEDELPQTYTTHTHCDFLNYSKFTLDNNHYLIELNGYAVNSRDFISVYEYSYRDIFSTEYDIKIAIDDFIYACSDTQLFLLVIPKRNKNKVVVTSKNPENIEKSTTRHSLLFGGKIEEDRSSINSTVSIKDTFQNFTHITGDFEKVN